MKKVGFALAAIFAIALAVQFYAYAMVGVGFAVAIAGALVLKGERVPAWVLSKQKPIGYGLLSVGVVLLFVGGISVKTMKAEHAAQTAKEAAEDAQVEELARTRCTGALTDLEVLSVSTMYGKSSNSSLNEDFNNAQKRVWRCKDEIRASLKKTG